MSAADFGAKPLRRVVRWMHQAGGVLTLLVMVLVCYDVTARQLFNRPFHGAAELAATGLVLIVFLQVPQSILDDKLLRVTFLYDRLGPIGRRVLKVIAWLAGTVVFGALALTSWAPLVEGLRSAEFYGMDSFRIPAWPLRVATLVLWVIACFVCLYLMVQSWRGRRVPTGAVPAE